MSRLIANVIVLLAMLFSLASISLSDTIYEITTLEPSSTISGNFSWASEINNEGVVIGEGSATFTPGVIHVWSPPDYLPEPQYLYSYNQSRLASINDLGQFVGNIYKPDGWHGYLSLNSIDLGIGEVTDINNTGQAVGWTYDSIYIYKNGVYDFLPFPECGGEATAINDSGVAVGYWYTVCTPTNLIEVVMYRNDSAIILGAPMGNTLAEAFDINNQGQIAGWYTLCGNCNQYRGFIWDDGIWTTIPTLWDSGGTKANAINDHGVVVGETRLSGGPGFYPSAFIFDTIRGIRDLNTLIPAGTGWELWTAYDINERGDIVGFGTLNGIRRGFLLKAPDTSVVITRPDELDLLFIAGEVDTIKWTSENVDSIRISVILHYYSAGQSEVSIVESFPADSGVFVWDIPDSLLSRQCRIVIQAVGNSNVADTGSDFKIKGWALTRITDDGEYEAFSPAIHGWSLENNSFIMWPSGWWGQFSYQSGIDPYTNAVYPSFFTSELHANPWDFIDWPLFVKTFGVDECYTTGTPSGQASDYWPSATTFWSLRTNDHIGSCLGLSATSIMAFANRDLLLQRFPDFGNFVDLYALPLNDTRREIISQLQFTQYAKVPKEYEYSIPHSPTAVVEQLKAIFLDEDRSNDAFLAIKNSRGGAHAVTPYKLVRDSTHFVPGDIYLLYVYDNNYPGDSTRAFAIRPSDGFWRYPDIGGGFTAWLAYGTGLYLEPFSMYLQDADLTTLYASSRGIPIAKAREIAGFESVYGFTNTAVMIRSGADSIGFVDTTIFNSIPDADAITSKTGYFSRPIGYRFPEQAVNVLVSNFTDSVASYYVVKPTLIYGISRSAVAPSDTDHLHLGDGIGFWNRDSSSKTFDMRGIVIDPGMEKVYSIHNFDMSSADSASFDVSSRSVLRLVNSGGDESYDLTLRLASPAGGTEVAAENIFLEANAGHLIWPDWSNLTAPIRIEIDEGNDGHVDDIVYANAQPTDVSDPSGTALPTAFELHQNYPNPFNPTTTIAFEVPTKGQVELSIFNILGQRVTTLVNQTLSAGRHTVEWNSTDSEGKAVVSGVYFYRIKSGETMITKKMLLVK
jgi:Secretion system C-terminal sorting domain